MLVSSLAEACTGQVRLRPYQTQAIDELRKRVESGSRRVLLVAPTGSGKTTIAVQIILQAISRGQSTLFLAHRRELILQTYRRLVQMGMPEHQVGVLMGSDARRRPTAPVQVASVDTLRNRAKPPAHLVFTDECQRILARSYKDIAAHYPNAVHIGLTATPYRADGRGLGDAYQELIVVASPSELIAQGYLVAPSVFTVPKQDLPDLSSVRIRGGDYANTELDRAVNRKALVGNIVEHWMKLARGKRTVAFAVSIEHSKHIVEQFIESGVPAEHLDGSMPVDERDAILARLEAGTTLVVSNCMCLTEGWDLPSAKCAILARPTKSAGLYLQQAGRIMRPWNGESAVILDHAGCAVEHGLPQDDREFSLEGKKKSGRRLAVEAPTKVCRSCCAVVAIACRTCPECGSEFPAVERVPEQRSGMLVAAEQAREQRLRDEWERLSQIAMQRGYKPGWVFYRFREMFGRLPPKQPASTLPVEPGASAFARIQAQERNPVWAALRYRIEFGQPPPSK